MGHPKNRGDRLYTTARKKHRRKTAIKHCNGSNRYISTYPFYIVKRDGNEYIKYLSWVSCKKFHKNLAKRKSRRAKNYGNYNAYRRLYDIKWEIW